MNDPLSDIPSIIKHLLLALPVLLLIILQALCIYAIQHHADIFTNISTTFGDGQRLYSTLIFSFINLWQVFPVMSLIGLMFYVNNRSRLLYIMVLMFTIITSVALLWSMYAPSAVVTMKSVG